MKTNWKALCQELLIDYEQHLYRSVLAERARAALAAAQPDGPAVRRREPASVAEQPTSPPDWRGLCEELLGALENEGHAHWPGGPDGDPLIEQAREALSQPEPEVVGATDDSAEEWQWYTYCPEEGIELYPNRQQAQSAAQSIMGSYEVAAHSDGWHEDMELVSWGMLVPVEQAQVVERRPADPGGEFDEWVRYELKPSARWGRPAPAPAGEVAELVAWLRNMAEAGLGGLDELNAGRAADLLEQLQSVAEEPSVTAPVSVPMAPYREVADLVVWLEDHSAECLELDRPEWSKFIAKAAKFLHLYIKAAPVPAGEVIQACQAGRRDAEADAQQAAEAAEDGPAGEMVEAAHVRRMCDIILGNTFGNKELDSLALLVGHHPDVLNASPVPSGEGVEDYSDFVAWLVGEMPAGTVISDPLWWAPRIARRAAELLQCRPAPTPAGECQAATVPVATSDRLPRPEDCDAEGRCWWFLPTQQLEILRQCDSWSFRKHTPFPHDVCRWTHWLPATALPLPQGEVEK